MKIFSITCVTYLGIHYLDFKLYWKQRIRRNSQMSLNKSPLYGYDALGLSPTRCYIMIFTFQLEKHLLLQEINNR